MSENRDQNPLSDQDIDRLLRNAPASPKLSPEQRRSIWRRIEPYLEAPPAPKKRLLSRRAFAWAGATALAAAAVVVILVHMVSPPSTTRTVTAQPELGKVEIARGQCTRYTQNGKLLLSKGASFAAGDRLHVAPGGGMRITLSDNSRLWLCEDTEALLVGTRSSTQPVLKVHRGEIRADIAHSRELPFSVETPAAMLRVLGTQFHCRVMPALRQEDAQMQRFKAAIRKALAPAVVVTVLSGAVAVHSLQGQEVVREGQRATVTANPAPSASSEPVAQPDVNSKWIAEPGKKAAPESLFFVPLRENLLHQLWAVNIETGEARHVSDFVGCLPRLIQRFGPNTALVDAGSILFAHFGNQPIGSAGRPLVDNQIYLVDLRSGEKTPMTPFKNCDPIYIEISPDQRKLAFTGSLKSADKNIKDFGVYVFDLESMKISRVLSGAIKTRPHWSPDSRWLAVSNAEGYTNDHEIVLVDTISGEIVPTWQKGAGAVFSPDGKRIVFSGGFKRRGSWSAGVPTYGNLFSAPVPAGTAEQITTLPGGGAVFPSFSPDGTRIAYWDAASTGPRTLHVIDVATGKDTLVTKGDAFKGVEWLDANSRLLIHQVGKVGNESDPEAGQVKIITLSADKTDVRGVVPKTPEPDASQKAAANALSDKIYGVFAIYAKAVEAQDLHRIEQAQAKYAEARDQLQAIMNSIPPAKETQAVSLSVDDLDPYLAVLKKEAAMTGAERTEEIVRSNLQDYIYSLLNNYYNKTKSLPASPADLAKWALANQWQTNHIRSTDKEKVRAFFVIPGESLGTQADPQEVRSSLEQVSSESNDHVWVLQTPQLPTGKKLKATYTIKTSAKRSHVEVEVKEVP